MGLDSQLVDFRKSVGPNSSRRSHNGVRIYILPHVVIFDVVLARRLLGNLRSIRPHNRAESLIVPQLFDLYQGLLGNRNGPA
jgi:hypothetical protein